MNKKKRNLLILVGMTLLLSLMLWAVMRDGDKDFTHDHTHDVSESDDEYISGILINEDQTDLKKITFSNQNAKYNVSYNVKSDCVEFAELKDMPVNSAFMDYIWNGVAQMGYTRIITSTESEDYKASDFGLDKPSLDVEAVFSSGKKYKFHAGINVPGETEDVYYVKLDGDSNVYSCTIDVSFFMGNNYFLSDDVFYVYDHSLSSQTDVSIGDITISGDKFNGDLVMKRNKISDKSDPFYGYDYVVTSPIKWPAKSNSAALIVHELTYLTADDAVVLNPTKKQLKQYGFDSPEVTISFKRNQKDCTLYIGSVTKSTAYMMLKDQPIIYAVDVDGLSILNKLEPNIIYNDKALSLSVETISSIKIIGNKINKTITVTRKSNDVQEQNVVDDETPIYLYTAEVNGKEIKYSVYTSFVKQLNNAAIQSWNKKKPSGDPDVTITISYFNNYKRSKELIKLYKVSDRLYSVVIGDQPVNQVSASWVDQLLKNIEQL